MDSNRILTFNNTTTNSNNINRSFRKQATAIITIHPSTSSTFKMVKMRMMKVRVRKIVMKVMQVSMV